MRKLYTYFFLIICFTSQLQFPLPPLLPIPTPPLPPSTSPLFFFREGQASHGCQPALAYQDARLDTSSPINTGEGNSVAGKGSKGRQQNKDAPTPTVTSPT